MSDLTARIENLSLSKRKLLELRRLKLGPATYPLSYAQHRLWLMDQSDPGSTLYNICVGLRLKGHLAKEVLRKSLQEVVRRHDALRTTFPFREGMPVQMVSPQATLDLEEVDLSGLAAAERE